MDFVLGNVYLRIIPAYAGQIELKNLLMKLVGDHPRIRGTNFLLVSDCGTEAGSSPHTRDKSMICSCFINVSRIIPAYAGQIQ